MLGGLVIVHVLQDHHLALRVFLLLVVGGGQFPAHHQGGQLPGGGVGAIHRAHRLPCPENGDPVRDPQHLPHLVADEHHALSFPGELADDGKEAFHLQIRQSGGGFVQDEKLRPPIEGLEDLHPLLLTYGNVSNELIQLDVQAVFLRQGQNLPTTLLLLDKHALGLPVSQNNVLKHRHGLYQHKVLVNHADAQLHRFRRGINPYLLPIEENLSLRGLIQSDQYVHQRGFSRAVLSQQRMYLTFSDIQVDIPVGVHIAKALGNVLHPQDFFHLWPSPLSCQARRFSAGSLKILPGRGPGGLRQHSSLRSVPPHIKRNDKAGIQLPPGRFSGLNTQKQLSLV